MFSPEGFVPLSVLDWRFKMEFQEVMHASVRAWYYEGGATTVLAHLTVQDFVEFQFLSSIEDHVHICAPNGTILRFDLRGLRNRSEYWELSWSSINAAIEETHGAPSIPANFSRLFNLVLHDPANLIKQAELESVDVRDVIAERGYDYFHQSLPVFYERWGFTITLAAFDYASELVRSGADLGRTDLDEMTDVVDVLRPFEGWAMCVPEAFADGPWATTLLATASNETKPEARGGRPPTIGQDTLRAYNALYPEGHGSTPWLRVLKRVNAATGHGASEDTLRRVVRGGREKKSQNSPQK
jgi:hypothetical protein